MVKIHLEGPLKRCTGEDRSEEGICDYGALRVVNSGTSYGQEVAILFCMLIFLRFLVYVALRYRAHE